MLLWRRLMVTLLGRGGPPSKTIRAAVSPFCTPNPFLRTRHISTTMQEVQRPFTVGSLYFEDETFVARAATVAKARRFTF
jgi:hypothetical protein